MEGICKRLICGSAVGCLPSALGGGVSVEMRELEMPVTNKICVNLMN